MPSADVYATAAASADGRLMLPPCRCHAMMQLAAACRRRHTAAAAAATLMPLTRCFAAAVFSAIYAAGCRHTYIRCMMLLPPPPPFRLSAMRYHIMMSRLIFGARRYEAAAANVIKHTLFRR